MANLRTTDRVELWLSGFGLMFLVAMLGLQVVGVVGQSQDFINATLFERMAAITARLDRIENYLTATIVALISNLVAHIVNIRSAHRHRQRLVKVEED